MTLRSELVLHDCYYAINKYDPPDQGEDFRIKWWSIISLLRAVGHVLHNVDRKTSDTHKIVIDREYDRLKNSRPNPEIYWAFIEIERNSFLKEYKHGVTQQFVSTRIEDGVEKTLIVGFSDLQDFRIYPQFPANTKHESFITSGPFQGQKEIEVALAGANWWKAYLGDIKWYIDNFNSS